MSVPEIFNSFPKDVQILIASNLTDQDVGKICFSTKNLSICQDNDRYWKMKILSRGDDIKNIPEGMSYRDYYEYPYYEEYLKERVWHDDYKLLNKMASDKVFLTRHINARDAYGKTALMYAIAESEDKIVKLLLSFGANVNIEGGGGWTPLLQAVANDDKRIIKLLLNAGANVNYQNNEGDTALINASRTSTKTVKTLLKAGANVNQQNNNGWTALMHAASDGREEIIKNLLAAGADINLQNKYGDTALTLSYNEKIKQMLLDAQRKQSS